MINFLNNCYDQIQFTFGIILKKRLYEKLEEITIFKLTNKMMPDYHLMFTSNALEKMQELIEKCWNVNTSNLPSSDEISETLLRDVSNLDESIYKNEI